MSGVITRLRQQPYWLALIIFVLLSVWVASGSLEAQEEGVVAKQTEAPLTKVRVTRMYADSIERQMTLYGRTEPDRSAMLRSEIQGQVVSVHVEEGQAVKAGQLLVEIDANDLKQQLASAKLLKDQRELELEGARSLEKKGYQSQVTLAQAKAALAAAEAQVKSLSLMLDNTKVIAPFDGVLNQRHVEVGDLLREGDNIATIVDLDPLIISADVTEAQIAKLSVGQMAEGRIVSGETISGDIRYISSISTEGTNTFPIEVAVANSDGQYKAGMSTELLIPFGKVSAIKVTPAVLALDEAGNLGVKTVTNDIVDFVPIDIIQSDSNGVWLAGFGEQADIITLGNGYVRAGDKVDIVADSQASVN